MSWTCPGMGTVSAAGLCYQGEKTASSSSEAIPKKETIVFRPLFMCKGFIIWSIYQSNISLNANGANHEMVPFILQSPNDSTWQVGPPVPRVTRWEFVLRFQDWTLEKFPISAVLNAGKFQWFQQLGSTGFVWDVRVTFGNAGRGIKNPREENIYFKTSSGLLVAALKKGYHSFYTSI